jgi:CBS domain-containing protein
LAKVVELMHAHVPTLGPNATLRDAVDKLDLYQAIGLPVVDGDSHVVGVVTQHDVVEQLFPDGDASSVAAAPDEGATAIEVVMTEPAITVDAEAAAVDALDLMLRTGIHMLPVVTDGKLVGTISRCGLCQAAVMGVIGGDPSVETD